VHGLPVCSCYICVFTCVLVCHGNQSLSQSVCQSLVWLQVQLQKMLDKERQIRSTTEQFALQLQLSRQEANECATAMQQAISDQVIHLTAARCVVDHVIIIKLM